MFRPFVPVSLAAGDASTPELEGLIDTGADAILASDPLADELGLDLAGNEGEELHAVGGRTVVARYKTVSLRLHHHDDSGAQCEWKPRWDSSMAGTASASSHSATSAFSTTSPSPQAASLRRSRSRIAAASMIASAWSWPSSSPLRCRLTNRLPPCQRTPKGKLSPMPSAPSLTTGETFKLREESYAMCPHGDQSVRK